MHRFDHDFFLMLLIQEELQLDSGEYAFPQELVIIFSIYLYRSRITGDPNITIDIKQINN